MIQENINKLDQRKHKITELPRGKRILILIHWN